MKKFILIMTLVLVPALAYSAQRKELDNTSATLGSSSSFTGTKTESVYYDWISVTVNADQDSATDGLVIQQSSDNDCVSAGSPNWDVKTKFTHTTSDNDEAYLVKLVGKCVQVKYTNGGTMQGTFRLRSFLIPYGE